MELCFHNTVKMYSRYKIREYQYKYFMKMTPNDNFLYKCKLVNSRLCNFCAMAPGTYTYLFFGECHIVQKFWTDLNLLFTTKGIIITEQFQ